jgi:phage terminase large subunit|tara:strand:+ start:458 stop:1672 length:1215 start_codon:yes stop_codon:yes gene_type:complete
MKNLNLNNKYQTLFNSKDRYFVITGGRGSGKSFAVNTFLVLLTYEAGHRILFTRFTMTSAGMSIIPEFIEKIELMGIGEQFTITKTEIINNLTGSSIYFSGIRTSSGDQTAKLKSIQGVSTFVLDEAEELTDEESFDKIDFSIRAKNVTNRCILILNPTTKENWIYQRFFQNRGIPDGFNGTKNNITYIHTTYLDNLTHLSKSFVKQIDDMKIRRPEKYKHQIMGGWLQRAEGVIFTHWNIGKFNTQIDSIYGLDFGFSVDPSALVEVAIDKVRKIIWLKEHFYKTGLTTSQIYDLSIRYAGKNLIVCDNSEPRLISELKSKGLNVVPTIKRKGSILTGISLMQDHQMIVDSSSINLIREFNNYSWKLSGSIPHDSNNHLCDSSRYAIQYLLTRSVPHGSYFVK